MAENRSANFFNSTFGHCQLFPPASIGAIHQTSTFHKFLSCWTTNTDNSGDKPTSHWGPAHSGGQLHWYAEPCARQVPPFWQGVGDRLLFYQPQRGGVPCVMGCPGFIVQTPLAGGLGRGLYPPSGPTHPPICPPVIKPWGSEQVPQGGVGLVSRPPANSTILGTALPTPTPPRPQKGPKSPSPPPSCP